MYNNYKTTLVCCYNLNYITRFSQLVPLKHSSYGLMLPGHQLWKPRDVRRIISTHSGGFVHVTSNFIHLYHYPHPCVFYTYHYKQVLPRSSYQKPDMFFYHSQSFCIQYHTYNTQFHHSYNCFLLSFHLIWFQDIHKIHLYCDNNI